MHSPDDEAVCDVVIAHRLKYHLTLRSSTELDSSGA